MAQQKVNVAEHEKNFEDVLNQIKDLKSASRQLRQLEASKKNSALLSLADQLITQENAILNSNRVDLENLPPNTPVAFRDRLTLNRQRLSAMAESLRQVAALPDPVGEILEERKLKNGLLLKRVRAPLGVIFMIFESRPNVILEAFSLAFKTGNAIILRGGSESKNTAASLYSIMQNLLDAIGLGHSCFLGINRYDRSLVEILLQRKDLIDITVPRGGERLIEFVEKTALMPIIKNDRGLCHTYVDKEANLEMAVNIVTNAKTQRPGVCNSLETVLVHEDVALKFLPLLHAATDRFDLRWKCDSRSLDILRDFSRTELASQQDWDTEHLDQIINCAIVKDLDQALNHIEMHGSKHSEAIITENQAVARRFQNEVDAAVVYWNASTRFTDGFEFGLGGELGISTQKLHVRGPVGLKELTTPRWIIDGDGQIRL